MPNREAPRFAYRIHESPEQFVDNATALLEAVLRRASDESPVRVALAGGSTPKPIYESLARSETIDWTNVHVFFGDERTVDPNSEESNFCMARESLLDAVGIPVANVHRIRGECEPVQAAQKYESDIRQAFGLSDGQVPRFDLIALGMGADGHTASLFPGTAALEVRDRLVVANQVPQLDTVRITLTYPVLNAAHQLLFLVTGSDKAPAIEQVMYAADEVPPAGQIHPEGGSVVWLLDQAAASNL